MIQSSRSIASPSVLNQLCQEYRAEYRGCILRMSGSFILGSDSILRSTSCLACRRQLTFTRLVLRDTDDLPVLVDSPRGEMRDLARSETQATGEENNEPSLETILVPESNIVGWCVVSCRRCRVAQSCEGNYDAVALSATIVFGKSSPRTTVESRYPSRWFSTSPRLSCQANRVKISTLLFPRVFRRAGLWSKF